MDIKGKISSHDSYSEIFLGPGFVGMTNLQRDRVMVVGEQLGGSRQGVEEI